MYLSLEKGTFMHVGVNEKMRIDFFLLFFPGEQFPINTFYQITYSLPRLNKSINTAYYDSSR